MTPLILAALRIAAPLAASGLSSVVKTIFEHVNANETPKSPAEQFASEVMQVIPNAIAAGMDVSGVLQRTNAQVGEMIRQNRPPNEEERASQAARIKQLEDALDQAARARKGGQ